MEKISPIPVERAPRNPPRACLPQSSAAPAASSPALEAGPIALSNCDHHRNQEHDHHDHEESPARIDRTDSRSAFPSTLLVEPLDKRDHCKAEEHRNDEHRHQFAGSLQHHESDENQNHDSDDLPQRSRANFVRNNDLLCDHDLLRAVRNRRIRGRRCCNLIVSTATWTRLVVTHRQPPSLLRYPFRFSPLF